MAATSVSGRPSTRSVGTLPSGLTARNSKERVSLRVKDRGLASNSAPISCNAMCTAIELEPGAKKSVSIDTSTQAGPARVTAPPPGGKRCVEKKDNPNNGWSSNAYQQWDFHHQG